MNSLYRKAMQCYVKGLLLAAIASPILTLAGNIPAQVLTPYGSMVETCAFIQAAATSIDSNTTAASVVSELQAMNSQANINTVNIYGLESWEPAGQTTKKDILFGALQSLSMKVIPRIEQYPSTFSFSTSDAAQVTSIYKPLFEYLAADSSKAERVAYLALNMPVDDPAVQKQLGGLNSAQWKAAQEPYAAALIGDIKSIVSTVPLRLSVFYGWNGGFETPSYKNAGADGYFLTSYSYPPNSSYIPGLNSPDSLLIDQAQLTEIMGDFTAQYGNSPVVVEYGFHTVEYPGVVPSQTAGLVETVAAKAKALALVTAFYQSKYSGVDGTSYFGWNIVKEEGSPLVGCDWALQYP